MPIVSLDIPNPPSALASAPDEAAFAAACVIESPPLGPDSLPQSGVPRGTPDSGSE